MRGGSILAIAAGLMGCGLAAQSKPSLGGDYAGVLGGALHIRLHIVAGPNGALSCKMDSVDQGAMGIPCADVQVEGSSLSFRVPAVNGTWKGTIGGDGKQLSGTWNQGSPMALNFTRETFEAAEKPSAVDGVWLGAVAVSGRTLHAQIEVKSDRTGREYCSFDSLDQDGFGWECANVRWSGDEFSFDVPKVQGRWSGKLASDRQKLAGTWVEGGTYRLDFARQSAPAKPAAYAIAPAMAPVKPADIEAVLERDLAAARTPIFVRGALSEGTGGGLAIGVVQHGVRRVFAVGAAKADSIFEIGSVTKTFTALMLARMVDQGLVKLEEPVRELLPAGAAPKPEGAEITLLDLATQHSGLPRLPDNLRPRDIQNPYASYSAADLYQYLAAHGVAKPANAGFLYSNLGFGLLGQALADRAGKSYAALLEQEITGTMGLKDTGVALTPAQRARFIQGHDGQHRAAHAWDFEALAGAGAIRSSASDMLTYLEGQLHPEKFASMAADIRLTHQLHADAMPGMKIGLAWLYVEKDGYYWHNGATGGYSSYVFFDAKNDCAGVALFNTTITAEGSFADLVGAHLRQRLLGEAAVSLGR